MAKKKNKKKLHCCEKCQYYWTCETKWYRGEHGKENVCCDLCIFYPSCSGIASGNINLKSLRSTS